MGASLVRIEVQHAAAIEALRAEGIEPWADHPRAPSFVAHVPAQAHAWLDASGHAYDVIVPDLKEAIDAERQRLSGRAPAHGGMAATFDDYRDLAEIEAHLQSLADLDPTLAHTIEIGTSLHGRTILGLRIERAGPGEPKPVLVVNGTQHAREWIAAMSTLRVADALVKEAPTDPAIDALLDQAAVLVVPVVNPDGYVYTWEHDRLWRKNRRDDHGVDLNRNFPVAWGGEGAGALPDDGNYRGAAPLSEPEAMALAGILQSETDVVAVLDVHSYGQLVLTPWSFTVDPAPADDVLSPLGASLSQTMAEPWGTEYVAQPAAELYLAAGTWPDTAYGTHGVHAVTLELRPADAEIFAAGFLLPAEEILDCSEEVLAAVLALGPFAAEAGPLEPGDDGDAPGPMATTGDAITGTDSDTGRDASSGEAGETRGDDDAPATTGENDDDDDGVPSSSSSSESGAGAETSGSANDEAGSSCACRAADRAPGGRMLWGLFVPVIRARRRAPPSR